MTITTKYEIEDTIFYLRGNGIASLLVANITIQKGINILSVSNPPNGNELPIDTIKYIALNGISVEEGDAYTSKQEVADAWLTSQGL